MPTTIITNQSWFSRIGSSARNVIFGFIFIIASIILLFWNEGNAVNVEKSLKEGASAVTSVSSSKIDPKNEGSLVHFTGEARTPSLLTDDTFGVSGSYLKLQRDVEVYQWIENTKSSTVEKLGGGTETTTTYSYETDWRDTLIDSSTFQEATTHQNPTTKRFEKDDWIAANVSVGAFSIPSDMINSLSQYEAVTLNAEMLTKLPYDVQEKLEVVSGTLYYDTQDVTTPKVGDTRITFKGIVPQTLSVVASQKGNSLAPFITSSGKSLSFIQTGKATASQMFENALKGNAMMTWILRIVGLLVLFAGFRSVLGLLPIIASVVPFLGRIIGAGMSIVAGVLTLGVGITVIAISWIFYRPIIGIVLLVIAGLIFFMATKLKKKK